jgi:hypothetical protein
MLKTAAMPRRRGSRPAGAFASLTTRQSLIFHSWRQLKQLTEAEEAKARRHFGKE